MIPESIYDINLFVDELISLSRKEVTNKRNSTNRLSQTACPAASFLLEHGSIYKSALFEMGTT